MSHSINWDLDPFRNRRLKYRKLDDDERAVFLKNRGNENLLQFLLVFNSNNSLIFWYPERNEDKTVKYIHYYADFGHSVYKVGSGGYIPEFHPDESRIHEFMVTYIPEPNMLMLELLC